MRVSLTAIEYGVMVLLEKVAGTKCIEKFCDICLLEADFNWWLKVIFARQMMYQMKIKGAMPLEQGAVKGKQLQTPHSSNNSTSIRPTSYMNTAP